MRTRGHPWRSVSALLMIAALALPTSAAAVRLPPTFTFTTPAFHLTAAPGGGLLVADAGAGIVKLRHRAEILFAALPGVTDVAPIIGEGMFAVTGGGPEPSLEAAKLYQIGRGGRVTQIADLREFEATVNPDGSAVVDTNPFSVATLNDHRALVADAGGNVLLTANDRGNVDWVALFPEELVSTQNAKDLAGCPEPAIGFEFACDLPPMLPAQPVPTSIAIGPDGAYYVGELKGFPAPTGESRIWRVEPGTRHADCATSPACSVVADGFTSIVDLTFGPDGTLYVTELDEASWAAVEFQLGGLGGTVNACSSATWACSVVATGLSMPMSTALARDGKLYVLLLGLVPGSAEVVPLSLP